MAQRQCLRLITVDETTVSSSRSSSSSRLLLLHYFAYVFVASVHRALLFSSSSFLLLPFLSHSLHRVPRVMSLIFCSPFLTLLFFFRILLISFYFVLRAQYIPFSLRRRLLASSFSFCIPVIFSASLGSRSFFLGLPVSSWFFSFVITHGQYASTKAAACRSGLNVPHRN